MKQITLETKMTTAPTSQEIHDMIQTFPLAGHPELIASNLLNILDALNRRIDDIESRHLRSANTSN